MKKIRIFLMMIFKTIGSGLLAFMLLCVVSRIYSYYGDGHKLVEGPVDWVYEPYQYISCLKEGHTIFRMDENGYNNKYIGDKRCLDSIDILLMGSSHMEAKQISPYECVGYLLNEKLDYFTYNISIRAHNFLRCVNNLENALLTYKPSKYIILETDNICLDQNKMQDVLNGNFNKIDFKTKGILHYYVNEILGKILPSNQSNIVIEHEYLNEPYEVTLDKLFKYIDSILKDNEVEMIIFYHPTLVINELGELDGYPDEEALDLFSEMCDEYNIDFIDMTDGFVELYKSENRLAHGFSNTAIGVGHLNKYGHRVCAERIAETIREAR